MGTTRCAATGRNGPARETFRGRFLAHVPERLDVPAVLARHRLSGWSDLARWVVSAVVVQRRNWDAAPDQYVPLSMAYVERHVGEWSATRLVRALKQEAVLESDGIVRRPTVTKEGKKHPGKCYYYRLGEAYRDGPVVPVRLVNPDLIGRIARSYQQKREAVSRDPLLGALMGWHDRVEVADGAPDVDWLDPFRPGGVRWFEPCDQGRVHTTIATLKKEYRKYIRLADRRLKSVDASCSQPLLLALLVTQRMPDKVASSDLGVALPNHLGGYISGDCQTFLRDCLDGSLYDHLVASCGLPREVVKVGCLRALYDNPHIVEHPERRKVWAPGMLEVCQAFIRTYPHVYAVVRRAWKVLGRGGLPRLMQALEAHMFIRRVAGRLVADHPDVPVLTQHDAVLVAAEHVDLVTGLIRHEFRSVFGVCPRLKDGWWDKDDAPVASTDETAPKATRAA